MTVITAPSRLYEFWKISPLDLIVFVIGLSITLANSIEHGIFTMVGLSLAVLLFRVFQAHGSFLGRVKIRTLHTDISVDNGSSGGAKKINFSRVELDESMGNNGRSIFLPLDKKDGSNPRIQLEAPYPGVFIYRLREGFKYANCSRQLDHMVEVITNTTVRGEPLVFEKPGVSLSSPFRMYFTNRRHRTDPGISQRWSILRMSCPIRGPP
jgi:solute carrier family 26 (sodium-independent sulfate anion transporter), member 11